MRKYSRTNSEEARLAPSEWNFALFVLYLGYRTEPPTFWRERRYFIQAKIEPKDEEVAQLLARHRLLELQLFVDEPAAKEAESRRTALAKEKAARIESDGDKYLFSEVFLVDCAKQALAWYMERKVVRLSLASLLDGVELGGSLDEMQHLVRALTATVDALAARIVALENFEDEIVNVFSPGKSPKKPPAKPAKGKKTTIDTSETKWKWGG